MQEKRKTNVLPIEFICDDRRPFEQNNCLNNVLNRLLCTEHMHQDLSIKQDVDRDTLARECKHGATSALSGPCR